MNLATRLRAPALIVVTILCLLAAGCAGIKTQEGCFAFETGCEATP